MEPKPNDEQERERLTRRANKVRSRLLADVDTLDARRQALAESVTELSRSTKKLLPVIAVGAAGAVAVGVAVWLLGRRRRHHAFALLPFARVDVPSASPPKSGTRKLVENLAGTLALAVARRLAARAVVRWVQPAVLPVATVE
jgi:hypothetical protein